MINGKDMPACTIAPGQIEPLRRNIPPAHKPIGKAMGDTSQGPWNAADHPGEVSVS